MSTRHRPGPPAPLTQRELDLPKAFAPVLEGQRSHVEAARLLGITPRHVRRLLARLHDGGDAALAHRLRGRPSDRPADPDRRRRVPQEYRAHFPDFGPTLAHEKLAERGPHVGLEALRRRLIAEGLWQPSRRRDT